MKDISGNALTPVSLATVINVFVTALAPQFCEVLSQRQGQDNEKLTNDFCAGVLTVVAQSGMGNVTALERLLMTKLLTEQQQEAGFCYAHMLLSLHARGTPGYQGRFVALLAQILSKTLMHPDAVLTVVGSPLATLFCAVLLASPPTVVHRVWTTLVSLPQGEAGIAAWTPTPLTALVVGTLGLSQAPVPKTPSFQSALVTRLLNLTSETFSVCPNLHPIPRDGTQTSAWTQAPAMMCLRGVVRDATRTGGPEASDVLTEVGNGCMQTLFSGRTCLPLPFTLLLGLLEETLPTQREENVRALLVFLTTAATQTPVLAGAVAELCSRADRFPPSLHGAVRTLFHTLLCQQTREQRGAGDTDTLFRTAHVLACFSLFCRKCDPRTLDSTAAPADAHAEAALAKYYRAYEDTRGDSVSQLSSSSSSSSSSSTPPAAVDASQQEMIQSLSIGLLDALQRLPAPPLAWPVPLRDTMQRLACQLALLTSPTSSSPHI